MKPNSIIPIVAAVIALVAGVATARGQGAVRLQNEVVIPARLSSSITEVDAATDEALASLVAKASLASQASRPAAAAQARTEPPPAPPASMNASFEAGLLALAPATTTTADEPALPPRQPVSPRNAEMVARMRAAVEKIAAEYGSPTFVQLFTNDSVMAQVWRKRLQMIQNADLIATELASLQRQKKAASEEVEAARRRLSALQIEAEKIATGLRRTRTGT